MNLLNDCIKERFLDKTPCELNAVKDAVRTLKGEIDKLMGDVVRLRHENDIWRERADTWQEKEQLARDALAVACLEVELIIKKYVTHSDAKGCPICFFTEPARDCDNDCPVCLANYFLDRAKEDREAVENNRIVREEQEGRKEMDEQDSKRAEKEAL